VQLTVAFECFNYSETSTALHLAVHICPFVEGVANF